MKFTKSIFTIAILAIAGTLAANGQIAGVYPIGTLNGGINRILAATTNTAAVGLSSTNTYGLPGTSTNLVQSVAEYQTVGLTWSYGAGSNATLQVFKTFDNGTTFEANPSFSYSGPAASSAAFSTNVSISVTDCTGIGFVLKNASNLDLTNVLVEVNLKLTKLYQLPGHQ